KYLIRLPNTSGKDRQRVRAREGESGFACCADDRPIGGCDSKEVANGVCHCVGKPLQVKAVAGRGLPVQRLDSLKTARFVLNRDGVGRPAPVAGRAALGATYRWGAAAPPQNAAAGVLLLPPCPPPV